MFDKMKNAARAFVEFWKSDATEPAHFEHWICQGVAADGTEFEHEGGWVLVSGLVKKDAIPWLMCGVKADGYFRDAHLIIPLATTATADWQKVEEIDGVIPYDKYDFQIDHTYTQMMERLAAGQKLLKGKE